MVSKKLIEMREKVREELNYIYKGDLYQNMLRGDYFNLRMHSLSKKADKTKYPDDKNKILKIAIETVTKWAKNNGVNFQPQFDKNYFKI